MRERIKEIMDVERLTPSLFADKLNVGRAVISHILNGRNNPSLDVVTRILETMDYIDADWLISGRGSMRKKDNLAVQIGNEVSSEVSEKTVPTNLFDQEVIKSKPSVIEEPSTDAQLASDKLHNNNKTDVASVVSNIATSGATPKEISKIIIYYADNTFQAFNPDSSPF